jgi:acetate kinase
MESKSVLAKGGIEKIGLEGSFLKLTQPDGEKVTLTKDIPEHTTGVRFIISVLTGEEYGVIKSINEIDAVGHRMVHGGEKFSSSVLLTDEVMKDFEACNDLAPLHNPANIKGVNAVKDIAPDMPQVGVFDTSFHQTLPDYAYIYGVPYELYEKYGIRRYGFHGTSHRYITKRALEMLNIPAEGSKIITCHIGNGGSVAAVKDGKSVDTSMGMTPLAGLMMGTRSGDVDPGALPYIMDKTGLDMQGITDMLNKKSGVVGISGVSSDMREVSAAANEGNKRAQLSNTMYFYRIKKYIGAYAAAMGGVDVIIFAGGVGENQADCRETVLEGLEFIGVELDKEVNAKMRGEEAVLSTPESRVKVLLIPTDEELMIASDTYDIVKGLK